jgi:tetratricopeptide (TPR) repeat protein
MGIIKVIDAATGHAIGSPFQIGGKVNRDALQFSGDSTRLLAGSQSQIGRIWDIGTGAASTPQVRHRGIVWHTAISPDARLFATLTSPIGTRVWEAATGDLVAPPFVSQWTSLASGGAYLGFTVHGNRAMFWSDMWNLDPDRRPVKQLLNLAQLLSGERFDPRGGSLPIPLEELRRSWAEVRIQFPDEFTASQEEVRSWQRRESFNAANWAERRRDWKSTVLNLGRVMAAGSTQEDLWVRRGSAYAEMGSWTKAVNDFRFAISRGCNSYEAWRGYAYALLAMNDFDLYRTGCKKRIQQLVNKETEVDPPAVWMCLIRSINSGDTRRLLEITRSLHARSENDAATTLAWGACLFRYGSNDEAIVELTRAAKSDFGPGFSNAYSRYFLAMALTRSGRLSDARQMLAEADELAKRERESNPPPSWVRRLTFDQLHREASLQIAKLFPAAAP